MWNRFKSWNWAAGKQVGARARVERAFTAVEKNPSEIAPTLGGSTMLLLQGVVCCLITLDLRKKRNKIQKGCRFLCLKYLSTSALLPKKGMPPTNSGAGSTMILLVFRVHSCLIATGKVLKRFPLSCEAQGKQFHYSQRLGLI